MAIRGQHSIALAPAQPFSSNYVIDEVAGCGSKLLTASKIGCKKPLARSHIGTISFKPRSQITKGANNVNKIDIVKKLFDMENPERFDLVADDFQSTDSIGSPPLDKAGWQGRGDMLRASLPDIKYVIEDIQEDGEDVKVVGHFSGTFANDLDASAMGQGVIPATGKMVDFAQSHVGVSFKGDKILRTHTTDTGPDAGLPGFIKALGAGTG